LQLNLCAVGFNRRAVFLFAAKPLHLGMFYQRCTGFLFLALFIPALALAQAFNVDSLKKVARSKRQRPAGLNALKQLADYYSGANTDSCLYYATVLKTDAEKEGDRGAEAYGISDIGFAFQNRGNIVQALALNLQAEAIFTAIKDSADMADTYISLSGIYAFQQNAALNYQYLNKARTMALQIKDNKDIYLASMSMSDYFAGQNRLDSALFYAQLALQLEHQKKTGYPVIPGSTLISLANVYTRLGQAAKAAALYRQAIADAQRLDRPHLYAAQLAYAYALFQTGQPDSALVYAEPVQEHVRRSPDLATESTLYGLLAGIYAAKEDYRRAFQYQRAGIAVKDSLSSEEQARQVANLTFNENQRVKDLASAAEAYRKNLGLYGACLLLLVAIVIGVIFWRANKKEHRANTLLKSTQNQLIQSAKMASLGEVTAGIAHEIQNPLNFVNNFSEVNFELLTELLEEQNKEQRDPQNEAELLQDIRENTEKIKHHGHRAGAIVKSMLEHSRSFSSDKTLTDLNALADEYMRLSYHGLRAREKDFEAAMTTRFDTTIPKVNIVAQDMGRVLLNLFNNAFYAVNEKMKSAAPGYVPEVTVTTRHTKSQVLIVVRDNGAGIPDAIRDKVMQPFFTTKPTGEGTGLGLSLSYDIVAQGHGGALSVESKPGEFTEFTVSLSLA
jgi:two-component system NtrC family sensor kinase